MHCRWQSISPTMSLTAMMVSIPLQALITAICFMINCRYNRKMHDERQIVWNFYKFFHLSCESSWLFSLKRYIRIRVGKIIFAKDVFYSILHLSTIKSEALCNIINIVQYKKCCNKLYNNSTACRKQADLFIIENNYKFIIKYIIK